MSTIIFDSGPIISLTMNNLLWLLKPLKESFKGDLVITESVKREIVDRPLESKKYKFEALQVLALINEGTLTVLKNKVIHDKTLHLMTLANNTFKARGNYIQAVHYAEIASIVAYNYLNADAYAIDERTTRLMIEDPKRMHDIYKNHLHTHIDMDPSKLRQFTQETKKIKMIRSAELVTRAFELGLLNKYLSTALKNPRDTLLESVLWGVKLNGCAISTREIDQILKLERLQ